MDLTTVLIVPPALLLIDGENWICPWARKYRQAAIDPQGETGTQVRLKG